MSGILLVDKPAGPSSHGVVSAARKALDTRKIGHAGTLDPMATGLLVLGVGTSTRLLTYLVGADKTYTATIRLGSATVTDDAEGDIIFTADDAVLDAVTDDEIQREITLLTGVIEQRPSAVSAIKVDGQRAYNLVRAGDDVVLDARTVTVSRFESHAIRRTLAAIDVDVTVDCSSGTYIRALARDIGAALGCGGHLTALRRTRVGSLSVEDACLVDDISAAQLIPATRIAMDLFPVLAVTDAEAIDIGHGKKVATTNADVPLVAVVHGDRLIAIATVSKGVARVVTGFPHD
ncbi:MAG: tRNA pseudouridine(55) synthase TruB [Actinomycetota bacterium]|jgi:tRNA pseudouridine55 synthase